MDSLNNIKQMLTSKFKMKDNRKLCHFLGIDFNITQGLLERFNMLDCKLRMTLCEQKLDFINSDTDGLADPRKYCEIIGSLIYLTNCTWPNLSYIVGNLSQYLSKPYEQHWTMAKHLLRYIKGSTKYQLCYRKRDDGQRLNMYNDADWASDQCDSLHVF